MAGGPRGYDAFDSAGECDRLERQAALRGIDRFLAHIPLMPPRPRILDAGSGSGAMARLLASRHPDAAVVGLDLNPRYLAYARARAAAEGLTNLAFVQGDVQALPFQGSSFDLAWSQSVLYFLPRPTDAVREFRRVLAPGGALVVALNDSPLLMNEPEDPALQARLERTVPALMDARLVRRLALLLRAAGFADVSVEVEFDRIWTVIGPADPARRRNVAELVGATLPRVATILGGHAEAEAYLADLLAYLDRPDTCTYTTHWVVRGVASGCAVSPAAQVGHASFRAARRRRRTGGDQHVETTAAPRLEFAFEGRFEIAPPIDLGAGSGFRRRALPILGGAVRGPRRDGTVLPGGADHQRIDPDASPPT
jgi:ubiquinone/menaquinone biosynthesis C-methylase UbiE